MAELHYCDCACHGCEKFHVVDGAENWKILRDLADLIAASPMGWSDGDPLVRRVTSDVDVAEWLRGLRAIGRQIMIDVLPSDDDC